MAAKPTLPPPIHTYLSSLHPFPSTYLWDFGIRMGPSSWYQPSSSFLTVTTRPPMWLLASKTETWGPKKLLSFPGPGSLFSTLYSHPHPVTGSNLEPQH